MAIYEITHKNDKRYIREGRVFFGVGNCITDDDYELKYEDNLSKKNYSYCELTGFYAIFKHSKEPIIGIEHYRRAFLFLNGDFITEDQVRSLLKKRKIILPVRHKDKTFNMHQFYSLNHFQSDYEIVRDVIKEDFPEYSEAFHQYFEGHWTYYFNMIICEKKYFDDYCKFIFAVLKKVEQLIGVENDRRIPFQKRTYGYISERLLNVWVLKNFQRADIYELPVAFIGGSPAKKGLVRTVARRLKYFYINSKKRF